MITGELSDVVRIINQVTNEKRYSRRFIDGYIREEFEESEGIQDAINTGVQMLNDWLNGTYHESKMDRLAQIKLMNLHDLVTDIFVGISYFLVPELFTSVTAQLAGRLGFDTKEAAITTMAEMVAVLSDTGMYSITKASKYASLMVESHVTFSEGLMHKIEHSEYLPPIVCEPRNLINNRSSAYQTVSESLILGSGNHHEGDICLDALNIMNSVELQLDVEFISKYEEEPTYELETPMQKELWKRYKKQCYYFYKLMVDQGNRFHLAHKVDKRGRAYAQGYHITTQGTSFKKACIDLYKEELVTGV